MKNVLKILIPLVLVILLVGGFWWYQRASAPTRVAFLNYMDFQFSLIADANTNAKIEITRLAYKKGEMPNLSSYDAVFFFAHGGVNLDENQQAEIKKAQDAGVMLYAHMPTGDGEITNLEGEQLKTVEAYVTEGGKRNIKSLLNYVREKIDGKSIGVEPYDEPFIYPENYYYGVENEEQVFKTLEDFEAFRKEKGWIKSEGAKIALVSMLSGADFLDPLVEQLQARGMNVYPVSGWGKRLEYVQKVEPDLVIWIAHGRFAGNKGPQWLEEANIPMLSPPLVFVPHDKWLEDQQGMAGGMLSQGVVMPEVDGGTTPYVVAAQFPNEKGLNVFKGIGGRVEKFAELVEKVLALKTTPNSQKKLAIFYYKGAGKNAMVAEGLEIAPSMLALLQRLKAEGYDTGELPADAHALFDRINREGVLLGTYAEGAIEKYWENGNPQWVTPEAYQQWREGCLQPQMIEEMEALYGPVFESHMTQIKDGVAQIAIPRVQFGNIVLIPVPAAGEGDDATKLQHGVKKAPPHPYVASYLWASQETGGGFGADALIHFGTHGSVEFTPWKQVALSEFDWPEALMANTPHYYLYSISNIGEALVAKRRTYATMMTHITPPFAESDVYEELAEAHDKFEQYFSAQDPALKQAYLDSLCELILAGDVHKDLGLDDFSRETVTDDQLLKMHHYLHDVAQQKITIGLHVLGESYKAHEVDSTLKMMAVDYLAYNLAEMDVITGKATREQAEDSHFFDENYYDPALEMADKLIKGEKTPEDYLTLAKQTVDARGFESSHGHSHSHGGHVHSHGGPQGEHDHDHASGEPDVGEDEHDHAHVGEHDHGETAANTEGKDKGEIEEHGYGEEYDKALKTYRGTLHAVLDYKKAIETSPTAEVDNIVNALNGGFVPPQSGGDPVVNPRALPSGRNTYGIDAEKTPSKEAWKVGKNLAQAVIDKKLADTGKYPEKVAFSLWSSEFVRQEGITIAEILYLLGCEPVRNHRGTVHAVKLIPMEQLKRPRIDVVVQTSGQFRDLGASRLYLINDAVRLAAAADDDGEFENYVKRGSLSAQRLLKDRGVAPEQARTLADIRVFGGLNGNYGTAIMDMVEDGDSWEKENEVAEQYINNMGAMYDRDYWAEYTPGAFEAALQHTDTIIQPRSSNTWGPLSLDHVYEFMGGMSNAARLVNGESPQAYFSDLRNPNKPRIQGAKEAIWQETRSTLLNPKYIEGLMEEGQASSAEVFAETFRNTYGWDVMKSEEIDPEVWDQLTMVYVDDKYDLDVKQFFERENPYALQEMTAVMLETVRKGYWQPDAAVVKKIAKLHADLIDKHEAGCSGFVCDNAKLRELIAQQLSDQPKQDYLQAIASVRVGSAPRESAEGLTLEKQQNPQELNPADVLKANIGKVVALLGLILLVTGAVVFGARKRSRI